MTDEEFEAMPFDKQQDYLNGLSDDEVNSIYENVNFHYQEEHPTDSLITYDEYKTEWPKMEGSKCFVHWCKNKAIYKVGDERYWCGMCEDCAGIRRHYLSDLRYRPIYLSRKRREFDTY